MTKEKTIHTWFNRFMTFYPAASVPKDAAFPRGTYELVLSAWGEGEVNLAADLWYDTAGEDEPGAMAQAISEAIGAGGVVLPCDTGYIWLKRGSPWCQSLQDEANPGLQRRHINVTAEYLTTD